MNSRSSKKVGWWFLVIGLILIVAVGIDMFIENYHPKAKTLSTVTVDGKIVPGEYTHHFYDKKTKYSLYWRIIGKNIYFAMHSPDKGWVAVGLGAKQAMLDADIYMAYVKNGKTYFSEEYGNSPYSHVSFKSLGAKPVVEKYAATLTPNGIYVEFERPLKVDSKYAKNIVNKPMKVIFAYSDAANFTAYHGPKSRGETKINFFAKASKKKSAGLGMWVEDVKSYQIAFIVWGVLFLIVSFIAFVTGWIEGDVSEPVHVKKSRISGGAFLSLLVLGIIDIGLIAAFVVSLFSKTTPTTRGLIASVIFFILAIMVVLYRKYFIDEEVVIHEMDDQLPW